MTTATIEKTAGKVVSHDEWLAARKKFLAKEKEFTKERDELSRLRRELPWEKVEKKYVSGMYCQCGSGGGQRRFNRRVDGAGRKSSSQEER